VSARPILNMSEDGTVTVYSLAADTDSGLTGDAYADEEDMLRSLFNLLNDDEITFEDLEQAWLGEDFYGWLDKRKGCLDTYTHDEVKFQVNPDARIKHLETLVYSAKIILDRIEQHLGPAWHDIGVEIATQALRREFTNLAARPSA